MIDEHKIEDPAKVYLVLSQDGTKWEIDPVMLDGYPAYGYDDGPVCDFRHDTAEAQAECDRLIQRAPTLPTLSELHALIGEYL